MKRLFYTIFAISALILASCSNKVDLCIEDQETTIIYGMLDPGEDTTFFKITKSFIGNANEVAQNYQMSNYTYDEIEVTFSGVFDGSSAEQTFTLDTISKWIPYDPTSLFYSGCRQTYYYTSQKLAEGKEYTLNVLRKNDNVNVSAKTSTINRYSFVQPIVGITNNVVLDKGRVTMKWKFNNTCLSSYFEVAGYFHYKELMPGAQEPTRRTIVWNIKSGKADSFYNANDNNYVCIFAPSAFFNVLANDDYLNQNSPAGVQRFFEDFEYRVTAIGEDLYNYYIVNNSSSAIQDTPNYTNVENGIGLMGSRVSKSISNPIIITDRQKISTNYPKYGFEYPLE